MLSFVLLYDLIIDGNNDDDWGMGYTDGNDAKYSNTAQHLTDEPNYDWAIMALLI